MNLLLITEETKTHYVIINDFNKFMYINQTKHKERNKFCMYCLQCFSSEQIKRKIVFQLMVNKQLKCLKKVQK